MRVSHFLCILLASAACAAAEPKAVIDSGSFSILVNGRRVATETFRMEQKDGANLVTAELRSETSGKPAVQSAEMEIAADGNLRRYAWKETSPGKASIVVAPKEQFLELQISDDGGTPSKSTTHPLSAFTSIVDDNFFSQLQVLTWKYMAMGCTAGADGQPRCNWTEQKLPILNPHQQQSLVVTVSYLGTQKLKWKGGEQECRAFKFAGETGDWTLWMDPQNRLVRVLIAAENTEVLRD